MISKAKGSCPNRSRETGNSEGCDRKNRMRSLLVERPLGACAPSPRERGEGGVRGRFNAFESRRVPLTRRAARVDLSPPAGRGKGTARGQPQSCHRQIPEPLQILPLLLVARGELEQPCGGAAENIVLGPLGEERQIVDRARQVEVPVRIVGGIEQAVLGVHHAERAL